jgi:hypothetical protein
MKITDSILYIEFNELEACNVSRRTILSWDNIKDPTDKRKILINYELLKDKYQKLIIEKFGDPYLYVHNKVIKQYLRVDAKAIDFYTSYRTADNIALPVDKIKQYATCACWTNLLIELDNNWGRCKKVLCMKTKPELYDAVIKIMEAEVIKLPLTYQTLKRKIGEYKEQGYECFVSKKYGNTNSKKVKDELNTALLIEMISHPAQYDDTFISIKYNKTAQQVGFKTITPVTVGNYRHKNAVIVKGARQGKDVWYDIAGKVIHQKRPSAPLLLVNSDDNELDVFFQQVKTNKAGQNITHYYYRPTLYVVIDAFNDYILGYSIGDANSKDLIKAAYLDAANHVKQLTGGRYFWQQIKTDRWGIDRDKKNDFSQWFSSMAAFTPTQLGNSRGKVIEQTFRGAWSSKLREMFPRNYSGYNITAKKKVNRDWLESNKKNFPTVDQAATLIADFINEMRQIIDRATGKTKQQQWLDAFGAMLENKKRLITDEQHLMLLGLDHTNQYSNQPEANTITKSGLTPIINGEKYIFEVPKDQFLNSIGKRVNIKYDPYDLGRILAISADQKTRLVCSQYNQMPMALADYLPDTPDYLNSRIGEKMKHARQIASGKEERQVTLQRHRLDAESILTAGVIKKELKHAALQLFEGNSNEDIDMYDLM